MGRPVKAKTKAIVLSLNAKQVEKEVKEEIKDESEEEDLFALNNQGLVQTEVLALQKYLQYCCNSCTYKSRQGLDFKAHIDTSHHGSVVENNGISDDDDTWEPLDNHDQDEDYHPKEEEEEVNIKQEEVVIPEKTAAFKKPEEELQSIYLRCFPCKKPLMLFKTLKTHIQTKHSDREQFDCLDFFAGSPHCQATLDTLDQLMDHIKLHLEEIKPKEDTEETTPFDLSKKDYQCKKCEKSFKHIYGFTRHVQQKHKDLQEFVCSNFFFTSADNCCPEKLKTFPELTDHIKLHIKDKKAKEKWACNECTKVYDHEKQLKRHIRVFHLGLGPVRKATPKKMQACPQCDKQLSGTGELRNHIMAVHEKVKPFVCDQCGRGFVRRIKLATHVANVHQGVRAHVCDQCGNGFSDRASMKRHILTIHKNIYEYKCDQCDYTGPSRGNLNNHIKRIHLKEKRFKCDFVSAQGVPCGQSFFAPAQYTLHNFRHMKAMKKKNDPKNTFHCDQCDSAFPNARYLKTHKIRIHKKVMPYQCSECPDNKGFPIQSLLKKHMDKWHGTGEPHPCTMCEKVFPIRAELIKHIKHVHSKTVYKCEHCDAQYVRKESHQLHVHKKHRWAV